MDVPLYVCGILQNSPVKVPACHWPTFLALRNMQALHTMPWRNLHPALLRNAFPLCCACVFCVPASPWAAVTVPFSAAGISTRYAFLQVRPLYASFGNSARESAATDLPTFLRVYRMLPWFHYRVYRHAFNSQPIMKTAPVSLILRYQLNVCLHKGTFLALFICQYFIFLCC